MNKITALVTAYNQKQYIEEAIESVLNQVCTFNFDVVVGDDGSDDGTWELLKEKYAHKENVRLIRMPRGENTDNIGATRASRIRLELLKYVTGEYFCFLDGDDFYSDSDKFQKQVNILDDVGQRECTICASNMAIYREEEGGTSASPMYSYGKNAGRIEKHFCWKNTFFHANACVFRSSIIKELPYDILDCVYNDHMIFFSALVQGEVYYIPDITMYYRQVTTGSIWTSGDPVISTIRGAMMADICNRIEPILKKESNYRYRRNIYEIYSLRNTMDMDKLIYWYGLAKKLNCETVMELLDYAQAPVYKKWMVSLKFYCRKCKYELPNVYRKAFAKVVGLLGYIKRLIIR